jgi:hypothetical protein
MALTNNGTVVNVISSKIPSGYTKPSVTTFTDYESTYPDRVITVAKSSVENADEVVTFTALIAAITTAVTTLIEADYDETANTIEAYAIVKDIQTNNSVGNVLYTNGALNYICTVDIYIKTS